MSYNKTTTYLAGMLEFSLADLAGDGSFINCYLGDHSYPIHYKEHLYVRVMPAESPTKVKENLLKLQTRIEKARKHPKFVRDYDLPNGEVMLVFSLDSKYVKDLDYFRMGKYSKIDREYVAKSFPKDSKRYKILTKDEDYRTMIAEKYRVRKSSVEELESIPTPSEEIFRYNDMRGWN